MRVVRGTVRSRGRGTWQLVVDAGRDPLTGRRRQRTRTFHGTRREADRACAEFVTQATNEGVPGAPATTVGELIEQWWIHAEPNLSPNTALGYRSKIDQYLFPALGSIPLRKLTTHRLDQFYQALRERGGRDGQGLAPNTVRSTHAIVHRACEQAIRWGWLARSPATHAEVPRAQHAEPHLPEPSELVDVLELVSRTNPSLGEIAYLAVMTGARRGELCGLQWADVDLELGAVVIVRSIADTRDLAVKAPKTTRSRRTVALDPVTTAMLRTRRMRLSKQALVCGHDLGRQAYVFSDDVDGRRPLRPLVLTKRWGRAAQDAGVKCRFHDLRHFTATQLLGAGVAVTTVSERLGHASTRMTVDVYGHPVRGADRQAAEVLAKLMASGES